MGCSDQGERHIGGVSGQNRSVCLLWGRIANRRGLPWPIFSRRPPSPSSSSHRPWPCCLPDRIGRGTTRLAPRSTDTRLTIVRSTRHGVARRSRRVRGGGLTASRMLSWICASGVLPRGLTPLADGSAAGQCYFSSPPVSRTASRPLSRRGAFYQSKIVARILIEARRTRDSSCSLARPAAASGKKRRGFDRAKSPLSARVIRPPQHALYRMRSKQGSS